MSRFVDRITLAGSSPILHLRSLLTRIILKFGTRTFATVTLVVLALSFLSPTVVPNAAQAVAWSPTTAQHQASSSAPTLLKPAEERNDKASSYWLGGSNWECDPCDN